MRYFLRTKASMVERRADIKVIIESIILNEASSKNIPVENGEYAY